MSFSVKEAKHDTHQVDRGPCHRGIEGTANAVNEKTFRQSLPGKEAPSARPWRSEASMGLWALKALDYNTIRCHCVGARPVERPPVQTEQPARGMPRTGLSSYRHPTNYRPKDLPSEPRRTGTQVEKPNKSARTAFALQSSQTMNRQESMFPSRLWGHCSGPQTTRNQTRCHSKPLERHQPLH